MIKLEILNTKMKGQLVKVRDGMQIGSQEGCKVRANTDSMLPVHAIFTYNATEGTCSFKAGCKEAHLFHNERDVMSAELMHGDRIQIGPLRFRIINESIVSSVDLRLDELLNDFDAAGTEEAPEDLELYDFTKEDLFYICKKNPALKHSINFTIPSKDRFIEQAQAFLSRLVHQADRDDIAVDEMKIEAFMTCCKELILNAHRHGHEFDETKVITIRYRDLGTAIQLSIEDQGTGFNHQQALDAVTGQDAAAAARERYLAGGVGGLGFQMITRMSNKLEYNDRGNIVTFQVLKEF